MDRESETAFTRLLGRSADQVEVPAGTPIFRAGDAGDVMYVVVEGEVEIILGGPALDTIGPGGILGEMALIDNQPRSATALARTDCKLVAIDEPRFTFLVHEHPQFALDVMRIMADRLRRMNARF